MSKQDKRDFHNASERKRRQNLKDAYFLAKDALPRLKNSKGSRSQILKEASAYITLKQKRNAALQQDIVEFDRHLKILDEQIALLQKGKTPKNLAAAAVVAENVRMALEKADNLDESDDEDLSEAECISIRDLKVRQRKQVR